MRAVTHRILCFLVLIDFCLLLIHAAPRVNRPQFSFPVLQANLDNVLLVVLKVSFQEDLPGSLCFGSFLVIKHKLKSQWVVHGSVGSQVG